MRNTQDIYETYAMNKAFRYAANFEHDFIEKAKLTPLHHMQDKFRGLYDMRNPTASFLKFYFECDSENQTKLLTYINNR